MSKVQELIPLGEAARQAEMTRDRLRRRIEAGIVDGKRQDGRWLVQAESLERFLTGGKDGR